VFVDTYGALTAARAALQWYPDDVWAYVIAADWARLAQELPLVGRTAERGDDLGSRGHCRTPGRGGEHLAHLIDRRWPPYAKWLGTSLTRLPRSHAVTAPLARALISTGWRSPEDALVDAVRTHLQAGAGLPTVADPVEAFWDRLPRHPRGGDDGAGGAHHRPSRARPPPRGWLRQTMELQRRRPEQPIPPAASASVRRDYRGVLGGSLGQPKRVLGAVDADAQRDHAQVLAEVHPIDHQRDQVQLVQRAASSSANAVSVAVTNRRETADLLIEPAVCSTLAPTGSSPTG